MIIVVASPLALLDLSVRLLDSIDDVIVKVAVSESTLKAVPPPVAIMSTSVSPLTLLPVVSQAWKVMVPAVPL